MADLASHSDPKGASRRYQTACDTGEAAACARGARLLLGLPRSSTDSAVQMFQKACDGGDATACSDLAQRFLKGDRVPKDPTRGIALLEAACLVPDAQSCEHAARAVEQRKDAGAKTKAQSLYERACRAGATTSCEKAAKLPAAPPPT